MGYFSAITDDASPSQRPQASETQLVVSAQRGESAAYAELCRRHREKVFRTVLKIIGNVDDAEDVLQDAWMRGLIHIKSFEGRASFSTWMTRIAINSALAVLRKRRKRKEFSLDDSVDPDSTRLMQMRELSSNPEERCIEAEKQRLVRQAIRRLPSKLRNALEIRESQDGSMHELAMVAGVPVPTMKTRLLRARLKLREPLRRALNEKTKGASGGRKGSIPARGISRHQVPVMTCGEAITHDPVGVAVSDEFAAIDTHSNEVRCVIGPLVALDARCDTGRAI
jgi:RNA polymerase sigma-70 factor (ECF subfamily)